MNNRKLPFRDITSCPHCHLRQFIRGDTKCRRCLQPLGVTYYDFSLFDPELESESSVVYLSRQTVGSMIRELRQMQGMTQVALADRLAIHRTHLSRIERERLLPRSDFLLRCIAALGTDMIILRIRDRPTERPATSNDIPPRRGNRLSP